MWEYIGRHRSVSLALAFALVAVALVAYFVQYRFGACDPDYCEIGINLKDGLVLGIGDSIYMPTGRIGLSPLQDAQPTFRHGIMGIFVRTDMPLMVSLIGGLVAPALLIIGALALLTKRN